MKYLRRIMPELLAAILLITVYTAQAAGNIGWKQLYIDYINNNPAEMPDYAEYSLIYIDDDDIPELWIDFGTSYEGMALCTVSDGKLKELRYPAGSFSYLERRNLFVIGYGRMDYYHDDVLRIQNGEFIELHVGEYGAEDNANVQYDANEEPIYQYIWKGKKVTKEGYEQSLNSVLNNSKTINARENSCSAREIINRIKRYE